ncbi:MAG: DUF5060 domain-containing protein [Armatimonadetes bacterium]|nr:DUF5060 domain-containing protein [Armatimonadota bacterium]
MKYPLVKRRALLATLLFSGVAGGCARVWGRAGSPSKITMRFELTDLTGNPFDFLENDIQVELESGGKTFTAPAFFDGGTNWEMRCTPPTPGMWKVKRVLRNGQSVNAKNIAPREFTLANSTGAGFIRRDPKNMRFFAYENGTPYYPIGCNAAWNSGGVVIETFLGDMGRTGQNWARIWMNHWDGKNLDWVQGETVNTGTLSLTVAKRWDGIVAAAETANVPFQMVFQHHGQYSEEVNPNWNDNPWSVKNGGFLATPDEFFTNDKARAYTRAKYRYIIARWGYSPHVLAWELYNEVQFTNSGRKRDYAAIAGWHKEMAAFIRQHDVHKHMVTTSSDENITGLYDAMDYRQPHSYPSDLVGTIRTVGEAFAAGKADGKSDPLKPIFYGEIGGSGDLDKDDGAFLHQILWSGIMTTASGAAQYWTWDNIGKRNLTGAWKPATDFLRVFGLAGRRAMLPITPTFADSNRGAGAASFGGGGGWEGAKQTRYTVEPNGEVLGAGAMSPYLQGDNNRTLLPFLEFAVTFDRPGTFAVRIGQVSKFGAKVAVQVDGETLTEKVFPAANTDTRVAETLTVAVPVGSHVVRLQNSGQDWARIERFTLSPYGAPAKTVAKADRESVAAWIYPSETPADAKPFVSTVSVPGLDAGKYRVFWWDTKTGKTVASETVMVSSGKPLAVKTPPITTDIVLFAAHERVQGLPK